MGIYRIMTNNQWKNDWNNDTWKEMGEDCSAKVRCKKLARVFSEVKPDVVGIQEVSGMMLEELMCNLQDMGLKYTLVWGKDTPVMYNPDKFELVDEDFFIYPDENPGFEGIFNNDRTKSWCLVVLRSKENGKMFVFMSTHIWWKSDDTKSPNYQLGSNEARIYQLKLATEKIDEYSKKYNCPGILVGDLNARYYMDPIQSVLKCGYKHAHDVATEFASEENGYHQCFGWGFLPYEPLPFKEGIDHIFVKGFNENAVKRFDRYTPDYYISVSDHYPAYMDIEI